MSFVHEQKIGVDRKATDTTSAEKAATKPLETVQETRIRRSCERDCAKNLVRLRWWKTQPPKSPLSGGLSTQFPPDKGG